MASNSTRWPSAQSLDRHTDFSMSGHSARQDHPSRRHEPRGYEQGPHQTTGHTVAVSGADSEDDPDVSLLEQDLASDATISTVITPEDLDRISREYDELVNKTYREVVGQRGVENSSRHPQEMNKRSYMGKRGFRTRPSEQKSIDGRKKRKISFDEPDHANSEDPKGPSTFLASIKTWRQTAGRRQPSEIYFQVDRLTDVKRDAKGHIRIKAHWTPIWVSIRNLRGQESYEAARELVVQQFGEDVWAKSSEGWDAMEPYVKDRIEYATE